MSENSQGFGLPRRVVECGGGPHRGNLNGIATNCELTTGERKGEKGGLWSIAKNVRISNIYLDIRDPSDGEASPARCGLVGESYNPRCFE